MRVLLPAYRAGARGARPRGASSRACRDRALPGRAAARGAAAERRAGAGCSTARRSTTATAARTRTAARPRLARQRAAVRAFCRESRPLLADRRRARSTGARTSLHCNDWQTGARAGVPALHAGGAHAATRDDHPQPRVPGRVPAREAADARAAAAAHSARRRRSTTAACSFLKAGLVYADAITTVSPTYAREIQREPLGMGCRACCARAATRCTGSSTASTTAAWDPRDRPATSRAATTPLTLEAKRDNKLALQRGWACRRTPRCRSSASSAGSPQQKGVDLLVGGGAAHRGGAGAARRARRRRARARRRRCGARRARIPREVAVEIGFDERARAPDRGGRRRLPDAVALRAVRPQPDVQPALRHAAGRARDRRPVRLDRRLHAARRSPTGPRPASSSDEPTAERARSPRRARHRRLARRRDVARAATERDGAGLRLGAARRGTSSCTGRCRGALIWQAGRSTGSISQAAVADRPHHPRHQPELERGGSAPRCRDRRGCGTRAVPQSSGASSSDEAVLARVGHRARRRSRSLAYAGGRRLARRRGRAAARRRRRPARARSASPPPRSARLSPNGCAARRSRAGARCTPGQAARTRAFHAATSRARGEAVLGEAPPLVRRGQVELARAYSPTMRVELKRGSSVAIECLAIRIQSGE